MRQEAKPSATNPGAVAVAASRQKSTNSSNGLQQRKGQAEDEQYQYGPTTGDDKDDFITILDSSTSELTSGSNNNERIRTVADDFIAGISVDP